MQGGNLKLRQHFEGQLNKYTNVMKGWQYRWFVLNPDKGTLEYHVSESEMKVQYRPRGALHLAGAVISPSEEDSHTFVVNSASGDVYKLRAVDAKERQEWITRLRVVAELHSQALAQTNSPLVSREHGSSSARMVPTNLSILDAFAQVQDWLQRADHSCQDIGQSVDRFPISGSGVKSTDPDILLLKATSQATLGCLEECLYALQLQQRASVKLEAAMSIPPQQPSLQQQQQQHQHQQQYQHSQLSSTSLGSGGTGSGNMNRPTLTSFSSPTSSSSTPVTPVPSSFGSSQKPLSSGGSGGSGSGSGGSGGSAANSSNSTTTSKSFGSNSSIAHNK